MKILSVASEVFPLVKTGGLADVAGALPIALAGRGMHMRTLMPGYPAVMQRLAKVEVIDPLIHRGKPQIVFGATVVVEDEEGADKTYRIVGIDEIDTERGYISWISPMARALLKAREGDVVTLRTPGGTEELEVQRVRYTPLATGGG